ncbi:MAG: Mut7-C RNAse domain-containing protein [Verrucomicrobia bacterium]|nr:Mut7-C RNAse domain-containing protein [Verrucomicrobiota bacterium]
MLDHAMHRTRKAYEARLQALFKRAGARRAAHGLRWFLARAEQLACQEQIAPALAMPQVFRAMLRKAQHWGKRSLPASDGNPPRFLCDAGLGGLARWLRAAGYEAAWSADITDDGLVREAQRLGAVALTTDSLLMERRVFRDGQVPSVWVPPSLRPLGQLELVFEELRLSLRASLCMNCGGPLQSVDKEAMRERIPPRTYRWLDQYFQCARCGQLFWHGTHWQHIQTRLRGLQPD